MAKYMAEDIENKVTQLRKGILELAIMGALYGGSHYGYSLVRSLTAASALDLKEGTIYPILGRLAKEGLVHSEWVESSQGPPRKYYSLTIAGQKQYEAISEEFQRLVALVEGVRRASRAPAAADAGQKIEIRKKSESSRQNEKTDIRRVSDES